MKNRVHALHGHTQIEHHSERGVSDLCDDAAVALKGGLGVPQRLGSFDRCNEVIDRAIKFLFGIRFDLANLPHKHFYYRITLGLENLNKLVHCSKSDLVPKSTVSHQLEHHSESCKPS